jgi:hypothetical protein
MRTPVLLLLLLACGGDPALKNVPRPNTAAVAGAAAGIAGAATLADPNYAAKRAQQEQNANNSHGHDVKEVTVTVPSAVLDRLDDAGVDAR